MGGGLAGGISPPGKHRRVSASELAHIQGDREPREPAVAWASLLGYRETWAWILARFLTDPVWWFYLYWIPKFLYSQHGLTLDRIGAPLVVIYLAADGGSIFGGWLSSRLLQRGWTINAARKTAILVCALMVTPMVFAAQIGNLWVAVVVVSLAAAGHQGWAANMFASLSDMYPKRAVSSMVGIAGFGGSDRRHDRRHRDGIYSRSHRQLHAGVPVGRRLVPGDSRADSGDDPPHRAAEDEEFGKCVTSLSFYSIAGLASAAEVRLRPQMEVQLGGTLGQMRAVPVQTGRGAAPAFLLVYGPDVVIDPFHEMFYYPTGTLNLALVSEGRIVWKRDLGRSVVPGTWFCPVFPFDLDGDGADEIWFVDNVDADHALSLRGLRLARLDARDGKLIARYPWPTVTPQSMSHTYRNFILGGLVRGKPVLVTAQGTYGPMALQGWNPDLTKRWETKIPAGPGPRGSHMTPVVDFDGDGVEESLWGERRIELDAGKQLFCADCDRYDGHSDVIQPVLDRARQRWFFFTCRESDQQRSPRVALFDDQGARIWGDLDKGHMDVGWVAHLDAAGPTAMALRIGTKTLGPKGLNRTGVEEFVWDALTGKPKKLGVFRSRARCRWTSTATASTSSCATARARKAKSSPATARC